jgi:isobutyryl-CoA mutase
VSSDDLHVPEHPVRFVTAGSLFDGHDAAINIMRRILQSQGAEVVHLGHDRSVEDVVTAALQEDAHGVAVSSYQGGHVEYFSYLVERLDQVGAGHIKVYGGGGGVIVQEEIDLLHERGVTRIFSPADGQKMGLPGMINTMIETCDVPPPTTDVDLDGLRAGEEGALARAITLLELGQVTGEVRSDIEAAATAREVPVVGITGTGGSGKSSLTDELVRRFRVDREDKLRIAVLAIDPSRRKGGGALLGDRIRMNSISPGQVFFRSMATREADTEVPGCLADAINACKAAGYDLVIVETPGIGQGSDAIVPYVDTSLYVMTPEFGAASQLEKIGMLDFADLVAINKFERRGAEDARRDVARQMVRNREAFGIDWEEMPVYGTSAARFDDDGVTALYQALSKKLGKHGLEPGGGVLKPVDTKVSTKIDNIIPTGRERYLADIAETVRAYHERTDEQADLARQRQHLTTSRQLLAEQDAGEDAIASLDRALEQIESEMDADVVALLEEWPSIVEAYSGEDYTYEVRGKEVHVPLTRETLSGNQVRRVALPKTEDHGELVRFLRRENLPGRFPFTGGVFPFKREGKLRRGCSRGRVIRSGPTVGSTTSRRATRQPGCRPPSTR